MRWKTSVWIANVACYCITHLVEQRNRLVAHDEPIQKVQSRVEHYTRYKLSKCSLNFRLTSQAAIAYIPCTSAWPA